MPPQYAVFILSYASICHFAYRGFSFFITPEYCRKLAVQKGNKPIHKVLFDMLTQHKSQIINQKS